MHRGMVFAMANRFRPEFFPHNIKQRMSSILLSSALYISNSSRAEHMRIHFNRKQIRIHLGRLIIMTAGEYGLIWLSTEPSMLQSIEGKLTAWRRDTSATRPANAREQPYPAYKQPPSINGFYILAEDPYEKDWPRLRECHFEYLRKAMEISRTPDHRTRHQPELLEYLAEAVGKHDGGAPDPSVLRSRLTNSEERRRRLAKAERKAAPRETLVNRYERNPDVVAEALYRAGNLCDLCRKEAPFTRLSDGSPYLEVHHCIPLAAGGDDTIDNALALCPACHRKLHFGMPHDAAVRCAQDAWRSLYAHEHETPLPDGGTPTQPPEN